MSGPAPPERTRDRQQALRVRLAPIADEYPFEPRLFDHGDALQHYVDEGPRDGRVVLFVHGNPTWSFAWRRLVRALRGSFRCVAPDHVGCGLSDRPRPYPYRLARHLANLERLALGLDLRRITLVVHDWGGPIGLGFARRHADRVEGLVVTNTAAFRSRRMPLRIRVCRPPLLGELLVLGANAFVRAATSMAVEKPLSATVRRGYLLPFPDRASRAAVLAFVRDVPLRPGHPSWDELVAIERSLAGLRELPALVCWGERDWCFTPAFRERWQELLPRAKTYRFPAAGHWLFEDAGDELRDKIEGFLERTSA